MKNHGLGQNRPRSRFEDLYHLDCGSRVMHGDFEYVCSNDKCSGRWKITTMQRFTVQDLQDRFFTKPTSQDNGDVLVRITEGTESYLKLMPLQEAVRKKIPRTQDPTKHGTRP